MRGSLGPTFTPMEVRLWIYRVHNLAIHSGMQMPRLCHQQVQGPS